MANDAQTKVKEVTEPVPLAYSLILVPSSEQHLDTEMFNSEDEMEKENWGHRRAKDEFQEAIRCYPSLFRV